MGGWPDRDIRNHGISKMNAKTILIGWLLLASPVLAQEAEPDSGAAGKEAMGGYMTAMSDMMTAMHGRPSAGDADADFLLMMIPHHQSAIDMARVELEHGDDDATRALAQQIIDAQEQEIADMKAMLQRLGVEMPG